jgi:hypothetical protein
MRFVIQRDSNQVAMATTRGIREVTLTKEHLAAVAMAAASPTKGDSTDSLQDFMQDSQVSDEAVSVVSLFT